MAVSFISLPLIPQPWANGGLHADIPNNATGTNRASFQEGWSEITSTPVADGGIPPNRLDFNGLGYISTAYAYALQSGKYWTFDENVSNVLGGYPQYSVLWYRSPDNKMRVVMSLIPNNTYNFVNNPNYIDGAKWMYVTLSTVNGAKMTSYYEDIKTDQIRNIQIVDSEPSTGIDGTIYAVIES